MKKVLKNIFIQRLLWIVLLLLVWEITVLLKLIPQSALPSIEDVCKELIKAITKGELLRQTFNSISIILKAMVISFIMALIIIYLSEISKIFKSFLDTVILILNPLPGVAILPLIMIWFGISENAILAIIVHAIVWPLIINLNTGLNDMPKVYREISMNLGLSSLKFIKDILLYSTMPFIISGFKIGWARAWRALISAEMIFGAIGSVGGIGIYIYRQRAFANPSGIFAGLIIVMVIGIFIEEVVFKFIENKTINKWK